MAKEMLINVSEGEECRIALVDNGRLEELYMERTSSTSHVGNIYKGRVTNVEPSIQAAFVDFGLGRNGFLHISDLMPSYFGRAGNDIHESVGRKLSRRDRPPIQRCLRRGDEIIVQIIKEGIGTKGPTLSTYLSIPGRILVMMPGMGKMGVSKKIEDEEERRRLRTILDSLKPPKGVGFIIRTAGIGKSKAEIQRDLTYLSRLWQQIEKKRDSGPGPTELYTEGDLVTRTVRDVFTSDVDRIVVDNKDVAKRVKDVIKITAPRTRNRVESYEDPIPLFHKYSIEKDIEMMYSRHVPLPSGGSLVIDSTEAIVAIDVNSGKFRDHSDAEMTAFKTDMEAAEEIPRQLKLRDLGGVIICDFIDLRYERHRRELEEKLHDNFKKDRAKTRVLRMSQFGIIEITRQRMRPSLKRSIYFDCPHCKGAGLVKTPESMSLDVMRRLAIAAYNEKVARIELSVCPDVSFYLLNKKRNSLSRLENDAGRKIVVRSDQTLGLDEMKLALFDSRDGLIAIPELGLATNQPPHTTQLGTRPHGRDRGGRGRDRGRGDRGHADRAQGGRPQQPSRDQHDEERFEIDETDEREQHHYHEPVEVDPELIARIAPKVIREAPEPVEGEIEEIGEEEDEPSVVDVEDGNSEIGERPAGEWDRQYGNDRGGRHRNRRGRGRGSDQGDRDQHPRNDRAQQGQRNAQPQQRGGSDQQNQQQSPRGGQNSQPQRGQPHPQRQPQRSGDNRQQQGRPPRPPQRPPQVAPVSAMAGYGDEPDLEDEIAPPGNQKSADDQSSSGQGPAGAEQGEGGHRRRRRRGGRRHRRRRERERLERERALAEQNGGVAPEFSPVQPEGFEDDFENEAPSAGTAEIEADRESDEEFDRDFEPLEPVAEAPREFPAEVEPAGQSDEPAPAPVEVEVAEEPEGEPPAEVAIEEAPKTRKRRGTRKPAAKPARAAKAPAKKAPPRRTPKRTPPKKSFSAKEEAPADQSRAAAADAIPVVRTGSADKHLADDEPVDPSPAPRRPTRRYDLDEIPDDYD
jgi:ribonuclease E